MKSAVPLTFLTHWQLLPVKSLFLKGTLLWAKPWYVHWHRLQDWCHEERAEAVQSYAVPQSVCYCTPAPPTALTVTNRSGEETQPSCKGRRPSQRWENQPVKGEAFHLTMAGSRSWTEEMPHQTFLSLLDPSPWVSQFLPGTKYCVCFPSSPRPKDIRRSMLLGQIKRQLHTVPLPNPKGVPLWTGLTLSRRDIRKCIVLGFPTRILLLGPFQPCAATNTWAEGQALSAF